MVIWQRQIVDDQEDPSSIAMCGVTGVAGCLRHYQREAENELVAALFILLLIWHQTYAIYRAKPVNFAPDFCKLTGGEISEPIRSIQHSYWAALVLAWLCHQCHSDHLPTAESGNPMVEKIWSSLLAAR